MLEIGNPDADKNAFRVQDAGNPDAGKIEAQTPADIMESEGFPRLDILKLELHLDADAAAVDQTPLAMLMMQPQAQRYVHSDGVSYTSDIVVQELQVDINGNRLSLETILGEMLDMPLEVAASM